MKTCFIFFPLSQPRAEIVRSLGEFIKEAIGNDFSYVFCDALGNDIIADIRHNLETADLCIADTSDDNPNVYYEIGYRTALGLPLILLRDANEPNPDQKFDISHINTIKYDQGKRMDFATRLGEYYDRIYRAQIDHRCSGAPAAEPAAEEKSTGETVIVLDNVSDEWKIASRNNDLRAMEDCLEKLKQGNMDNVRLVTEYVIPTAALDSKPADKLLMELADKVADSDTLSFKEKSDFFSSFVSRMIKCDEPHVELVEDIFTRIAADSAGTKPWEPAKIYMERGRYYKHVYFITKDSAWMDKALEDMNTAVRKAPKDGFIQAQKGYLCKHIPGMEETALRCFENAIRIYDERKWRSDKFKLEAEELRKKLGE